MYLSQDSVPLLQRITNCSRNTKVCWYLRYLN